MRKAALLRWIEEAEAQRVRKFAVVQRAASEPHIMIAHAAPGPT